MFNHGLRFRLLWRYLITVLSPKVRLPIKVLSNDETVDFILRNQSSASRFGEGEVQLMRGGNLDFQVFDPQLADRMKEILTVPSSEKFVVCIPDVFHSLRRYRFPVRLWWEQHLQKYRKFYQEIFISDWYGSAFISRPYMDWKKKEIGGYFNHLKEIWNEKDVLIIEGQYSRSGVGNDLFSNANSVQRILCPSRNAFSDYEKILKYAQKHGSNKLILIMLGPAAKVLAYDLYKSGFWAIDLGHIDSEYEWFKMGARKKVTLNNKHTAENNYDEHIGEIDDDEYQGQIIIDLSN